MIPKKPLRSGVFALALAGLGGCAGRPACAPWNDTEPIVGPSRTEPATGSRERGRLWVETGLTGIVQGAFPQRYRFFLYSERGQFLEDYPNDFLSAVDLAPGRYVVVARVAGRWRRVQAIVEPGLTTSVAMTEFERGEDADTP